jgi:hypothetical protein
MIDPLQPLPALKEIFSLFLKTKQVILSGNDRLPIALRELYAIKDYYDSIKPNNSLFRHQDHLVLAPELSDRDDSFDFLTENQSCWTCATIADHVDPPVYIHSAESIDIEGRKLISDSLSRFLATYALQELTFELDFKITSLGGSKEILGLNVKAEELWMNQRYTWGDNNRYNFWLIDENCILMDCSITCLATNDKDKFQYFSQHLKHWIIS